VTRDRILADGATAEPRDVRDGIRRSSDAPKRPERAESEPCEIRHCEAADGASDVADGVGAGSVAVRRRVRQRANAARIQDDDDASWHTCRRFGIEASAPLRAAAVAFAIGVAIAGGTSAHAQALTAPTTVTQPAPPVATQPPALPRVLAPTPAPSVAVGRRLSTFLVRADSIVFYSNRYVVSADGDVRVTLGDGTQLTGNTYFMDLRLNRFVLAGDVTVRTPHTKDVIHGAAFSEYFEFDRAYFVPIISEPDRWTFAGGDYAHPLLGREMPGDAFFLPDLSGERQFLTAKNAEIDPRDSVRFTPAKLNFGLAKVPFPSYFLEFSQNPNYAQNALPGAFVDGPLDFAGGANALASAHIRYDPLNGVFPAFEQHFFTKRSYVVAAASPLTRPLKVYNLVAYNRFSPGLQAQLTVQETAFQHEFKQPLSATAYALLQVTGSLPHSFLQLQYSQYYSSLLRQPAPGTANQLYYGDPTHPWIPVHPTNATLAWVGFREYLPHRILSYQLRSSVGYAHSTPLENQPPLQSLGGVNYDTIYSKGVGIDIATNQFTLVPDRRGRNLYATATVDKQIQWYSAPHHTDTTTVNFALTKIITPSKLVALVSYTNQNIGDFYGKQQAIAYPVTGNAIDPFTGQAFPGYNAFRGFATTRTFNEQLVWTPHPIFSLVGTLREDRDFPRPIPGPPYAVGPTLAFQNYGLTPYQATLEARYRFTRQLVIDVSRSYFFGFGGYERWQPQFSVLIEK